jgi:hypothetical protein
MPEHFRIVLTADTYTSLLPEVAPQAAEKVATFIVKAGRLVPGTARTRRRPSARKHRKRTRRTARTGQSSRAHRPPT